MVLNADWALNRGERGGVGRIVGDRGGLLGGFAGTVDVVGDIGDMILSALRTNNNKCESRRRC